MKRYQKSSQRKQKKAVSVTRKRAKVVFHVSKQELQLLDKQKSEKEKIGVLATPLARLWAHLIDMSTVIPRFFYLAPISLLLWILNMYLLTRRGQTIGKYFMKIQIIQASTGEVADWTNLLLLRPLLPLFLYGVFLIFFVSAKNYYFIIPIILLLTDALFIFRADRRCIHDLIVGTQVCKFDPQKYFK